MKVKRVRVVYAWNINFTRKVSKDICVKIFIENHKRPDLFYGETHKHPFILFNYCVKIMRCSEGVIYCIPLRKLVEPYKVMLIRGLCCYWETLIALLRDSGRVIST